MQDGDFFRDLEGSVNEFFRANFVAIKRVEATHARRDGRRSYDFAVAHIFEDEEVVLTPGLFDFWAECARGIIDSLFEKRFVNRQGGDPADDRASKLDQLGQICFAGGTKNEHGVSERSSIACEITTFWLLLSPACGPVRQSRLRQSVPEKERKVELGKPRNQ